MKRATLLLFLLTLTAAHADEGMWPPSQLPELRDRLTGLGLQIDPARLNDLTKHPMNAVIDLENCTASFVSAEGLAVTNHHCAYASIQHNSTEERDLMASRPARARESWSRSRSRT
jgi:hypothetical protein